MITKRTKRINSLLKEVLTEVIKDNVRNPNVSTLFTITSVDITKDLTLAKVYLSVIGTEIERQLTFEALQSASGFISVLASKKVTLRYFPTLIFKLDTSVDQHMKIDSLLKKINLEKEARNSNNPDD